MKVAGSYRSMQHLRELSGLLAVALLSSLLAVFPASNDPAVGDYTSYNAFQGDQTIVYNDLACDLGDPAVHTTAETAFEISTSAQLWEVTDCVSTSSTIFFELAGDIDLAEPSSNTNLDTSSPIGFNGSNPLAPISFSGVLNGNDKTIKNIAMSIEGIGVGLFAVLESATISNLVISGSFEGLTLQEDAVEDSAGALAIYASGIVNLYSVSNQANVTGRDNVGGLIGWTDGSVNITNTHNSGAISGSDWVGGIVGYVSEGASFSSSQNSGTVSATGAYVGGLAGKIAEAGGTGNFLNSGNHGSVSGAEKVGGIAGYVGQEANIESASNTATVSGLGVIGQSTVYGFGGLVGYVEGNATITASHNIGAVLSFFETAGLGDPEGTGGLLGFVTGNVSITASHNIGAVSSYGLGRYGAFATGGLVGYVTRNLMVIDSSNYGEITGENGLGGLGGYVILSTFISSSSNAGTISGESWVGGLVGESDGVFTISGSINTGQIKGLDNVGGLIGQYYGQGHSSILDSSNTATISARDIEAGGLVGYSEGPLTIVGSHNTGQISGLDETGGLVGTVNDSVTIINSMNSGQVSGSNFVGGLMGLQSARGLAYFENVFNSGAVSASGHAGGLAGYTDTFHIVRSGNKGSVSGQGGVGGLVGVSDGGDSTFSMVGNFASVSGTFDTGGLFGSSGECAACDIYIDNFVNAGNVIGSNGSNTHTGGIIGFLSGTVTALIGYNSGLVLGSFADPLAGNLGGVSEDTIGLFTTADSFLLSSTPVSSLQSEAAYIANAWGSGLTSNWGFGSCDFNQGLPIPRVFGSILGVTEFSDTGCIPVVIQDSSDASSPSSTPSYTGPTLTANNQLVFAGSSVIFSGSKLDLVTAVYVGESLVEVMSKTAGSITVRLPATLAAGNYDLMMYSSYGRLTVLGAVVVSTASITDTSNSSTVELEDLGSNLNLSDAAKLLIGKTKTIPNFAKDQNSLSTKQSAWLKDSLEDSGLSKIVCTGVIMESMSTHQKIQVRKLAKATCVEAAKYLGDSSVWYQSKLTTKAAYVRKVMVTFKG